MQPRMALYIVGVFSLLAASAAAIHAQASTSAQSTSDPQAVSLAGQAYAALTTGTSIQDVTLTGTERHIAGSLDETSPIRLQAFGTDNARIDRQLGSTSEVRTKASGAPAGSWTGSDGASHQMASHNCWTDAAWFFPIFSSAFSQGQGVQLSYVGAETLNGSSVQHIRVSRLVPGPSNRPDPIAFQLSQTDIYLDAQSFLPLGARFNIHPDTSPVDIPVFVVYSNYQVVNGAEVAFHVQLFLQNSLSRDLTITAATFNSGLTTNNFQVQ